MKTLAGMLLVSFLLVALSSGTYVACQSEETIVSYVISGGIINIIQRSEDMYTPFYNLVEEKYPLIEESYIVENEGYLTITLNPMNGSRPEMLLNDEPVYTSNYRFYDGKVTPGDVFEVELYPPEHLNHTFTITVDHRIITIYEVYDWDDMIGELIFNETPREEINTGFYWKPENPVENDVILLKPDKNAPLSTTQWTLKGEDVYLRSHKTYFTTSPLEAGVYNVTLFIIDEFGYNASETQSIEVNYDIDPLLYDPSLTLLEVDNVNYQSMVNPDIFMNLTVSLLYTAPIPRDIQVSIMDKSTGKELSKISDHINGEGITTYHMAYVPQDFPLELIVETAFLHEGQWISSGSSESFTINTYTPRKEARAIPGFPWGALLIGVSVYLVKRKVKVTLSS